MFSFKPLMRLIILMSGLILLATAAGAQENTATILGQVLDPSGLGIPGATVTVRNTQTGITRTVTTNESGNYTVPLLPIGQYDVTTEQAGFKKAGRTGIVLQVAQHARVDFKLEVGMRDETVMVAAALQLTQTDESSMGAVVDNTKVSELPLNGREFYSLALLVPSVVPPAQGSLNGFRGGFNVAGASELNNNFTLNGLDNNNQLLSAPGFRPSVDTIDEFKILTGTYPAEYGRNSGGQVIVTTKSGTNSFHGTAYEFLRNSVFDAKNFFFPAGQDLPSFKRNQFGGTLGGPIFKNKTFFFASYEALRLRQQVAALANVPLPEMVNGDFRQLLTLAKPIKVLNPFTGKDFKTPNVIDPELINPIGKALIGFYPKPTTATPAGQLPSSNYNLSGSRSDTLDQGSLRIDHTFSPRDTLAGHYNNFDDRTFEIYNTVCGNRVLPGFGCTVGLKTRLIGITETHIFHPNFVSELRLGFSTYENPRNGQDENIPFVQQYNIPGTRFDGPPRGGVPETTVQGYASLGSPSNFPQRRIDMTYQGADNFTYNRGNHSIKFGFDMRRFQSNRDTSSNGRGSFSFQALTRALTSNYALADMLLGLPTSTARSPLAPRMYNRANAYAGFGQDDWKVRSNLTLNFGVRFEYFQPPYEKYNILSNFIPSTGKVSVQGQDGLDSGLWESDWKNIEPRIGLAWRPFNTSRTVVRTGYGIFYNQPAQNNISSGPQQYNPPFVSAQTFNASTVNPIFLNDPFPAANAGAGTLTPFGISRNYPDGQIQQWNLNVQQEVTKTLVVELGYQGSKGTHLPLMYNINQPLPGPGTVAQQQAKRPYPLYGNISYLDAVGNSNYHGMTMRVEQRSDSMSFMLSYAYSKSLDNTAGTPYNVAPSRAAAMNRNNLAAERGLSGFDLRQRLVFSYVWRLPMGTEHKFLGGSRLARAAASGWEVSGILTLQTGRPFTALVSKDNSNTLGSVDRPNIVGNINGGPKTVAQWFNVSAFQLAPFGTFGNGGRDNIIGPSYQNIDFVLSRNIRVTERWSVQIRAEMFNTFNHPNFNLPVQTFDDPSFGKLTSAMDPRQIQFGLKIRF